MSSVPPPPVAGGPPPAAAVASLSPPAPSVQPSPGIQTPSPSGNSGTQSSSQSGIGPSTNSPFDSLYSIQFINDPSWPSDLRLDPSLSNWAQWSRRLKLLCKCQGFGPWLEGNFTRPDSVADPRTHHIWTVNDQSL